ncbi:MAG: chemotaxis protein CheA [Phycisphaerales bacterium]|nr:chemotaxis protein CheA [Phycisphaerales bacterium]
MSIGGFDREILQDFLTESGELLAQLEGDLVTLESTPEDPELLNQVFRALHTIKGSASFLGLTNLVKIAHAAESALNAARNGVIVVDRALMDWLLEAVDVVKTQMEQLERGEELVAPRGELVENLAAVGEGRVAASVSASAASAAPAAPEPVSTSVTGADASPSAGARFDPLPLDSSKSDLLEFFVSDLEETLGRLDAQLTVLAGASDRAGPAGEMRALCEELVKTSDFFSVEPLSLLIRTLDEVSDRVAALDHDIFAQLMPRLRCMSFLLHEQASALREQKVRHDPLAKLLDRVETLSSGREIEGEAVVAPDESPQRVAEVDGVLGDTGAPVANATASTAGDAASTPEADDAASPSIAATPTPSSNAIASAPNAPAAGAQASSPSDAPAKKPASNDAIEHTVRVEVGRLDTLMNLVGELVLQKNRIAALARDVVGGETDEPFRENLTTAAGFLDRVTADLQLAVMRTRMQPLDKIFGRYPRLIRDLAKKTGKLIRLEIEGGDTEVDKSVIEELGDPLVHLMRNSADHGLEMPDDRTATGKDATGVIRLVAQHAGSHVLIRIIDDGRGLVREKIAKKALERGLVTEGELTNLSDREVNRFIFLPGFSTADQVSDLSGRGVGMDVVRTNIEKLKGSVDVSSEPGKGTEIIIGIPLTLAIMQAMLVEVSGEIYAIPLSNIVEIVRPTKDEISSVGGHPVMRLRDSVLPLVDANGVFEVDPARRALAPFAVVLAVNEKRTGLMVSRMIGQQEIVIKPLDKSSETRGPVSGATVRDDGGVSLIVDVAELVRRAEGRNEPRGEQRARAA